MLPGLAYALQNWARFSFTFLQFAAEGRVLHAPLTLISPTIEDVASSENILKCMHLVGNGVRWKASVQRFEINKLRWASGIQRDLLFGTYEPGKTVNFDIIERGKLRHIQAHHVRDRAVQKAICNGALLPTVYPTLIYDNSASQEGKGTDFALKRLKEHLRWHLARYGKTGVIVIIDLHSYFDTIPHDKAEKRLTRHISDQKIIKATRKIIDNNPGELGLGLGSEVSQIGAISYTDEIDRIVKEKYGIHCYGRFNDDSYFICSDRKTAELCLEDIRKALKGIGLQTNEKKTAIHNLSSDDFVYLKKRVHIEDSGKIVFRIARKNIRDERKKILDQRAEYDAGRMSMDYIVKSYETWRNYAKKYCAYHTVGEMDKFFADTMRKEKK